MLQLPTPSIMRGFLFCSYMVDNILMNILQKIISDNIENIDKKKYLAEGMSGPYMQGLVGQFDLSSES